MIGNTRIAIRDSTDSFNIGFFDNEAGIKYHVADLNRFLAGSASILTLRYYSKDIDTIRAGCKLSFSFKGKDYWLNILDIKKTGLSVELTAFSINLEANNELVQPYKATAAETIVSYIKRFDAEKSFVIGINEVSEKTIKLDWAGKDTVLARLYSVANGFGAELEFVTELNDDYSLKRHVLNIYKKGNVGSIINSPVRVGKDLKVINYEETIKELYTAVRGKGKDGLTIAGLNKKVYDDKGNVLYYSNSDTVYAPQSRDRYPSVGKETDDNYILMLLDDSEYDTKESQYAYMLGRIKEVSQPKVTFTADGGFVGDIGDTRTLIDDIHYDPELYIQARITETVESMLTGETTKTVLSNYERKYSEISDDLLKRVEELAKEAMPYTLELATNAGTVFKNGAGSSQITPTLKRGSETISGASFVWTTNGTSTTASTYTVTAAFVTGTAVVKVEAILAGKVVASTEITFTDVSDGQDGAQGPKGDKGEKGDKGALDEEQLNDLQGKIDSKADNNLTQEQLNALSENQGLIQAELEAKASADTLDNWIKAYQDFVKANDTARAQAEKDLISASQRVSTIAKDLGELSDRWNFIDTYMSSSNEGLVIGKNDGSSSMMFNPNGRISMFSAGVEVMYISQGVIHIENGIFSKTIQIGRFREEQYHLNADMNVIRYVGG